MGLIINRPSNMGSVRYFMDHSGPLPMGHFVISNINSIIGNHILSNIAFIHVIIASLHGLACTAKCIYRHW